VKTLFFPSKRRLKRLDWILLSNAYFNPQLNKARGVDEEMWEEDTYNGNEGIDFSSFSFVLQYRLLEVIEKI